MKLRASKLRLNFRSADLLVFGLWTVVLILALILQAIPVFLVVMMFGLAVGIPAGAALAAIPIAFIAMLYLSCLIASKFAGRSAAGSETRGSGSGVRSG